MQQKQKRLGLGLSSFIFRQSAKCLFDPAKGVVLSGGSAGEVEWVCLQAFCTSNLRVQSFFFLQQCVHLNCDLSQLLGCVISSVGGDCVKEAHVEDSVQHPERLKCHFLHKRRTFFKKRASCRFSFSGCIMIISCLTSLTGRKVSLTHAPM